MATRKSLLRRTGFALMTLLILPLVSCLGTSSSVSATDTSPSTPVERADSITVYSVNDMHGKIDGSNGYYSIADLAGSIESDSRYDPDTSVIVSTGDAWQGSYASGYDYGETTTELLNILGVEAMALGNHEFDWGEERIETNAGVADFPFLACNLISEDTGKRPDWVESYTLVETGGYSLGFVGVIGPYLESSVSDGLLEDDFFSEDTSLVKEAYEECVEAGADAVFLLAHEDGYSSYLDNLSNIIPFAGIFAGHSHMVQNLTTSSGTPVLQGGANNEAYSYMTISTETWEVTTYGTGYVSSKSTSNSALVEALEAYIDSIPEIVYAQIEGTWNTTQTAYFILSAMLYSVYTSGYSDRFDANLMAIHNTGGVRDSYGMHRTPSDFTMSLIQQASPFDNTLYLLPDREPDYDQIDYHYFSREDYGPDDWSLDIVTISYLVNDNYSEMFTPDGAIALTDPNRGGDYIIYNAIADYASYIDSLGKTIDPDDFSSLPSYSSVLMV